MARSITVFFDDGSQTVFDNAPDDVTPEQVTARAEQQFGKKVVHLDGGRGQTVEGPSAAPAVEAAPEAAPAVPEQAPEAAKPSVVMRRKDPRTWGQWAGDKISGFAGSVADIAGGIGAQVLPVGAVVNALGGDRRVIDAAAQRASNFEGALGEGAVNLVPSAIHLATSIGKAGINAVAHPIDTAEGLANIASTVYNDPEKAATAIFDFYGDRYGDEAHLLKTMKEDPAGLLLDLGMAVTGVGGVARGLAGGAARLGATGVEAGANAFADAAKVGARAVDPFRVSGQLLSAPANAMRQGARVADAAGAGGVANAMRTVGKYTDVTAGVKTVAGKTVGGTMSLFGRSGGDDAARRMLTSVVPDGKMPDVLKALREADPNLTVREALATANIDADIIQAVGKAIEDGPGASWYGRRADVKKTERETAETAVVDQQVKDREAQGDAQAQDRTNMNADHEQDLVDLRKEHADELKAHLNDTAENIAKIEARQSAEVEALTDMHDMVRSTVGGDLAARRARIASARAQAIARLDERARGTLDELAGGETATAARQATDAERAALNDKDNPISQQRDEALADANVGNDNFPGMRDTSEIERARAAAETAKAKTAFAGSDRLRAQAEEVGADARSLDAGSTGRANAEAMWRELTGGAEMPLTATMEDLNRLRERAGGVERTGDVANAKAHESAFNAREAEAQMHAMASEGIGELNGKSIADRIRAKAAERPGNITLNKALTKMADAIERVSNGGAIRAQDLYDLRKDGVGSVADRLKKGFVERSASEKQVMGAASDVKRMIDEAIEAAAGTANRGKWTGYLEKYEAGSNPITQKKFAGKIRRMNDEGVIKTVRGENPEAVGKAFNGNYDVANAMSARMGPGAADLMPRLERAADDLALKGSKVDRTAAQLAKVDKVYKDRMSGLVERQKSVMSETRERMRKELAEAKESRRSGTQELQAKRPGDIAGVTARHKIEMAALKERQLAARTKLEGEQATALKKHQDDATAIDRKADRQAEMGRFEADELTRGVSMSRGARTVRAIAGILSNTRGARVAEVAKVFADAKIGKAMKASLVEAYKNGANMEKLLTGLTPSQRASVLAQTRKWRTVSGAPGQQAGRAQDAADRREYNNVMAAMRQ